MKRILIIICCLFLCGCSYDQYELPEEAFINQSNIEIECYSDIKLLDLISDTNLTIENKNDLIKTNEIGTHKLVLDLNYEEKKYKYDLTYEVVDKTSPIFISASTYRTVITNSDEYFCDEIVTTDNYDAKPSCVIEGEYDLTTPGTYKVNYLLTDTSNNTATKNLTIKVVDSIEKTTPSKTTKTNLAFSDAIAKYKTSDTMIGIDVSRWQTDIDFEAVKNAGVEFVIMRMAVQSDYDKDISLDSYYLKNIKAAKDAGLLIGVYVYSTAINEKMAESQAKWVLKELNNEKLDFPIAYDWENWSKYNNYNINLNQLSNTFNKFYEVMQNAGYDSMLYSSKFYLENVWNNKYNRPVWLAHYTSNTNYQGDYIMWQLSNVGKVDGINGDVDINVYYKNKKS